MKTNCRLSHFPLIQVIFGKPELKFTVYHPACSYFAPVFCVTCVDWASGSCAALLWEKSHLKSKPVHHNLLHYLTRLSERVVFRAPACTVPLK